MNKRTLITLICLVLGFLCMFLPFRTYPNASLEYISSYYSAPSPKHLNGFQMAFPVISLGVFALCFILIGYARSKAAGVISLIFSALNCIYMVFILFIIEFQLFHKREIVIGIGFYLLCILSLTLFIVSVTNMIRPQQVKRKNRMDLLDEI